MLPPLTLCLFPIFGIRVILFYTVMLVVVVDTVHTTTLSLARKEWL